MHVESLVNRLVELILLYHSNLEYQTKAPKGKLSRIRLNQVLEYIDTNLDCSITLEHLANIVDIDKFWFAKMFQRTTGLSPQSAKLHLANCKSQNGDTFGELNALLN